MFDLPSDWSESELRNAAQKGALSFTDGDWIEAPYIASSGIRLLQTGNVGRGFVNDKPETRKYISLRTFGELGCKWVRHGDILICRLADPIGRACEVPEHLDKSITSVDVTIFKVDPSEYSARYVLHYLNSEINLKLAADSAGGSTRSRISRTNLGQLPLPKPPLAQQIKIAEVFDTLDNQIQKTQALIAKLEKVKEGLLHDLLTRGIDESGRLRLSPEQAPELYKGSPLGPIPKSWDTSTVEEVADPLVGPAFESSRFTGSSQGVRLLRGLNVTRGRVRWDESKTERWPSNDPSTSRYALNEGDIVVGMDGALVGKNKAILTDEDVPSLLVQRVVRLRANPADCTYLYMNICSARFLSHIDNVKTHTAIPHITSGNVCEFIIPRPSPHEIVRISRVYKALEEKIHTYRSQLSKLSADKIGLMDDLLTGRVRVTPLLDQAQVQTNSSA